MSPKGIREDSVDSDKKSSENVPTDESQTAKKYEKFDVKESETEEEKPVKPVKREQEPAKGAKGIVNYREEKTRNIIIYCGDFFYSNSF